MAQYNTRILNKNDIEENWNKATNFIPKKGEIIIYSVDSNHSYPRFKVGDGKTLVSALPFSTDILDSYVTETELASALNETTSAINKNIATIDDEVATHIAAINNPHNVTKEQVGLSNVKNVDTTNASNLTTGTVPSERMNSAPAAYNMNPTISGSNRIYSNLGRPTLAEMACIDGEWANKIWFYDVDKLHFEIQATEGSEWEDITSTIGEENIRNLVDGSYDGFPPVAFRIPRNTYRYRITVDPKSYVFLNAIYMSASACGNRLGLTVEGLNQKTQIWDTLGDSENTASGWPAHFWFQHEQLALVHYQSTQDKMYDKARIVIKPEWLDSNTNDIQVYKIQWWGGYPWDWRTIYTWDNRKNVTFPANVKATSIEVQSASINGEDVALVSDVPDFGSPTANATTLAAGSSATASVTATGTNKNMVYNFSFGIPRGNTGPTGPTGPQGPTGSVASVSQSGTGFVSSISLNSSTKVLDITRAIIDDGELGGGGLINIPLSEASWQQIAQNAETGQANTIWNVGDEITFNLKDGNPLTMQIVGFNHDDLSDGSGKAGITFGMKNLYYSTYKMNSSNTNAGGWEACEMRTSTMQEMFNNLPDELQSVIKLVNKKATAGNGSTSITTSQDKIWLYSVVELDGTTESGYKDEGTQYEYWQSHNTNSDRIKKLNNGTGSANLYWLRSPYTGYPVNFHSVRTDGYVTISSSDNSYGVCFCFCI